LSITSISDKFLARVRRSAERSHAARCPPLRASVAAALTPGLAGGLVLERLGLDGADSPVVATEFSYPMSALLVALLLLAVAEAFRKGTELARDVDGLV
jgi:hypothetical protein